MDLRDFQVPTEDQATFVKFMAYVAVADSCVSLEELQAIETIISAWNLDEVSANSVRDLLRCNGQYPSISVEELASEFKNPRSGYLLIQELITLAQLDGNYDMSERNAVNRIAHALRISEERVTALEEWVSEGIAWREKGVTLITPEGVSYGMVS